MEKSRMSRRQKKENAPNDREKKPKSKWKIFWLIFTLVLFLGVIGVGAYGAYAIATAPDLDEGQLVDAYPIELISAEGEVLQRAGQNREYVSIKEVPEVVKQAVISIEDRRFYSHNGIDVRRTLGAIVANISDGFGAEGGSTITQQLVKQSFLSSDKTIKRKIQEQWLALKLEREYTKDQILEMYLNKNYFGAGAYGIQAASKTYFNKPVSEVDYKEAAILAGLPQRPSAYDPINGDQELTRYRQEQVLSAMKRDGHISEKQYEEALNVSIADTISPAPQSDQEKYTSGIFIRAYKELEEVFGLAASEMFGTGLKVYTSINEGMHNKLNKDVKNNNIPNLPNGAFSTQLNMGATVLNTKTGEIVAIVDGYDTTEESADGKEIYRNYAEEPYQIGSTAKPFFDYGPGIEYGQWSTGKKFVDKPIDINNFKPKNYYEGYRGANTMRYFLTISANTPAVQAFDEVRKEFGSDAIEDFARGVGIKPEMEGDELLLSNSLGTARASTVQMAGAYATLGNNGMYTKPHLIRSLEFNDGSKLKTPIKPKKAMEDYTAYMLTDMLRDVVSSANGTYRPGAFPWDVAGKTGTTNDEQDKWFNGFTTDYAISVWTGKRSDAGTVIAHPDYAQFYFDHMMQTVTNMTARPANFVQPNSVLSLGNELYVKGTKPEDLKPEKLSKPTALKATYDEKSKKGTLSWDFDDKKAQDDGYTDVTFVVTERSEDGTEKTIAETNERSVSIADLSDGTTTYSVVAQAENALSGTQKSGAATTKVTVKPEEAEPESETPEQPDSENPDNGNTETPGTPDNGDTTEGNGNSNENNGNSNGNNGNNGNSNEGNGNSNGDTGTDTPEETTPPADPATPETNNGE